jgi:DNA repair exonuclease SbcCD nuclease subunit
MKIAVISDMHLGYARFEEDSLSQAENAFLDANTKADLVICAGDVFDIKIPKLETLKRASEMFHKMRVPVVAIHGNHERRSKDMVNPVQLLAASGAFIYLHGNSHSIEKGGERVFVFGLGSVPEEYASAALKKSLEGKIIPTDAFRILVIHQTVKQTHQNIEGISFEELEPLPFDLILDGHIHEKTEELNGRFLIPGSTVITQLKKEEMEPRGYLLYDTKTKKAEFVPIRHRSFFFEELVFKQASMEQVKNEVDAKVRELRTRNSEAIIKLKVRGDLREGVARSDFSSVSFYSDPLVFIDNEIGAANIKERIERIKRSKDEKLSVREVALKSLQQEVAGKVKLFDPAELFEKLTAGVEEAEEYIRGKRNSK